MRRCLFLLYLSVIFWGFSGLLPFSSPQAQEKTGGSQNLGKKNINLDEIEIIATSPLPAANGMERAKLPEASNSLNAGEIASARQSEIADVLAQRAPGVSVIDVTGNPFQPQLDYRGFSASPVVGSPQGLAVYQNGVRINETWGDTVNWDLIPTIAIDRTTIFGANPIFGLNALGGAVSLEMKNGFTWQGFEIDSRGGSRGRAQGAAQFGAQSDGYSAYFSLEGVRDPGARYFSGSTLKRFYGDIGYRGDRVEIHGAMGFANNSFGASGPAPNQLISADSRAVYTTPQVNQNRLAQFAVNAVYDPSDTWTIQANLYHRSFDQARKDGNVTDFGSCGEAFLCADGDHPTGMVDQWGAGAQYGVIDRTWTSSHTFGASLQATNKDTIFDHKNRLTFGVSYDDGKTNFRASEELGLLQPNFVVTGTGVIVNEPASGISDVRLHAKNRAFGVYALDVFDVTDYLTLSLGGRFNFTRINLMDTLGTALNGAGTFTRLNPFVGATYKITPDLSVYASYSEANRAPTGLELGCADPARPCVIDNFLVSDPPLKQVVARTVEAGLRGSFRLPQWVDGKFDWSAGFFRTVNSNDILSVPSSITGRGYFMNAGATQRQGVETSLSYKQEDLSLHASYTLTDATFRDAVQIGSPNNPIAIALGYSAIMVTPGAHLSSAPKHRFKFGGDYAVTTQWSLGGDIVYTSGAYLRGDEINQLPRLPDYAILNLRTSFQINKDFQIYGLLENALNARAKTFGTLFNPTQIAFAPMSDPRMASLAPPLGAYVGLKYRY